MPVDKSGRVYVVGSVPLLHAEAQTVQEMLEGWRNQQLCRNLDHETIAGRIRIVERFLEVTNEFPWTWTAVMAEEFFSDLRSVRGRKQSTIRGYQNALRLFCSYVSHPDYGWDRVCEQRFGAHPAQVFFDWNTAVHVQDNEQSPAKRAFTKRELQDFFDHADDQVSLIAASGRKGWRPAYRDAVMFKLAYSYGVRFNEVRHLQTVDFSRNPHAPEFGRYGVVQVRYGKAKKGSPPKRRSVLTRCFFCSTANAVSSEVLNTVAVVTKPSFGHAPRCKDAAATLWRRPGCPAWTCRRRACGTKRSGG